MYLENVNVDIPVHVYPTDNTTFKELHSVLLQNENREN